MSAAQDLKKALEPKSDQLNADDLITGTKTITINKVKINLSEKAQKMVVHYEGDEGKPWKPSKGMGRVMAEVFGGDPDAWIGEQVTLYRNPDVIYAGEKVGGIQISEMTKINSKITLLITSSKGKKTSLTINPIKKSAPLKSVSPPQPTAPTQQQQEPPKQEKTPVLKVICEALRDAAKKGSQSFYEELAITPEKFKPDILEFITKYERLALQVDANS